MKTHLFFLIITMLFTSCKIQGLTNDYQKLNAEEQGKITTLVRFEEVKSGFIYKINGIQLRDELKKHPKSLVYIFKNGCTSDYCKPLKIYEDYAKANGYTLFLVMNGYANLSETLVQPITSALYAIDNEYYKIKYRSKYQRCFENDLSSLPTLTPQKEYLGNLFFFEKDKLSRVTRELP